MPVDVARVPVRAVAAGISDVGLQREHNEDCYAVIEELGLFLVADGMGGHRAGDIASKLASEAVAEFFHGTAGDDATWPYEFDARLSDEENRLQTAIRIANRHIHEHSSRSSSLRGMGTTIVGALFSQKKGTMYVGHVGDSRAYRVRDGAITQLTRDHSLVNEYLVAMPDMSEEQRSELPKNVITRALGMQDNVEVDLQSDEVKPGDVYILCSDGLSGMLKDRHIYEAVVAYAKPVEVCRHLVKMANERGGEDNITAVIIKIEELDQPSELAAPIVPSRTEQLGHSTSLGESEPFVDSGETTQPGFTVAPVSPEAKSAAPFAKD